MKNHHVVDGVVKMVELPKIAAVWRSPIVNIMVLGGELTTKVRTTCFYKTRSKKLPFMAITTGLGEGDHVNLFTTIEAMVEKYNEISKDHENFRVAA